MARLSALILCLSCCITLLNAAVISSSISESSNFVDSTPTLPSCPGEMTTCTMTLTIESTASPDITLTSTLWTDLTVIHLVKSSFSIEPSATEEVPSSSATPQIPTTEAAIKNNVYKKWSIRQKTKGAIDYAVKTFKKVIAYGVGVILTPIAYVKQG